ncbi:MAG: RpiB/LacA/LacB family sugar-phosphate isomerase [Myxococcota bacterium]
MRIALCSDEPYPVHDVVRAWLKDHGHAVQPFGAVASGVAESWVKAAEAAARGVARGDCDQGVFFCWSGTGICMAANKVVGIRAALCCDSAQAVAARVWNHANVLCLSNRALSNDMAKEILHAWFETKPGTKGLREVERLRVLEARSLPDRSLEPKSSDGSGG